MPGNVGFDFSLRDAAPPEQEERKVGKTVQMPVRHTGIPPRLLLPRLPLLLPLCALLLCALLTERRSTTLSAGTSPPPAALSLSPPPSDPPKNLEILSPPHKLIPVALLPSRKGAPRKMQEARQSGAMPSVRVRLTRFSQATTLTLYAEAETRLRGPDGEVWDSGLGPWTVALTGESAEVFNADGFSLGEAKRGESWQWVSENAETRLGLILPNGTAGRYRGSLEIGIAGSRLDVVNELALETYLRGVLACEIGAKAPLEAIKAQAVAARTYALYRLRGQARRTMLPSRQRALDTSAPNTDSGSLARYDLDDTPYTQVYRGANAETPNTDLAVQETSGLVLTQGERPIGAFYCADCGGITAPGRTPDECPRSVDDAEAHTAPNIRYHLWTQTYAAGPLASQLAKNPQLRVSGALDAVEIIETDSSGRANRLRLTWRASLPTLPSLPSFPPLSPEDTPDNAASLTITLPRAEDVSSAPPVMREMTAKELRDLLGVNKFRSTLFTVRKAETGEFVFEGRGWGHGRGMCQLGAMALAAAPLSRDFKAILRHYYEGATLTRIAYPGAALPARSSRIRRSSEASRGR